MNVSPLEQIVPPAILPSIVKKQTTRLRKIVCADCGAILRGSRKMIEEVGLPTCACGGEFEEAA